MTSSQPFAPSPSPFQIGFGTAAECLAHGTPLVYVRRELFAEEPFLRQLLAQAGCGVEIARDDFDAGRWGPSLAAAAALSPHYAGATDGAAAVAAALERLAAGQGLPTEGRPAAGEKEILETLFYTPYLSSLPLDVPPWFLQQAGGAVSAAPSSSSGAWPSFPRAPLLPQHDLADTRAFVDLLAACFGRPSPAPPPPAAAADLFLPSGGPLFVARAPGRLDVMGGIADYSGSLVLQSTLALAAHAAVQLQPRDARPGRIVAVSVGTEGGGRAGRCDHLELPLSALVDGAGVPVSFAAAAALFSGDAAWAGYMAGNLLTLMREKGACLPPGVSLALLLRSDVPEGKGVSSSAAVAVASMTALAAALGVSLGAEELATLAQRTENLVCDLVFYF